MNQHSRPFAPRQTLRALDAVSRFIGQYKGIKHHNAQVKHLLIDGIEGLGAVAPQQIHRGVGEAMQAWARSFRAEQEFAPRTGPARTEARARFQGKLLGFADKLNDYAVQAENHCRWSTLVDSFEYERDRIIIHDMMPNLYNELATMARLEQWRKLGTRLDALDPRDVAFVTEARAAVDDFRQYKDAIKQNPEVLGLLNEFYEAPNAQTRYDLLKPMGQSVGLCMGGYSKNVAKAYGADLKQIIAGEGKRSNQTPGYRNAQDVYGNTIDAVYALRWARAARSVAKKLETRNPSMADPRDPESMVAGTVTRLGDLSKPRQIG